MNGKGRMTMNGHRFAFRQWLKGAGFTAAAVLALALAIGANTAIAHPSSGIVVDKSGAVILTKPCACGKRLLPRVTFMPTSKWRNIMNTNAAM